MLAVLDPWLLHVDEAKGIKPLPYEALADLVYMLSRRQAVIPAEPRYWRPFVGEIVQRFAGRVARDHRYKQLLDRLLDRAVPVPLAPCAGPLKLAGFDRMFDDLGAEWGQRMRLIVSRAALTNDTILLTRLLPGRNAREVYHDRRVALVERLCWELRVETGEQARTIPCVASSRNERIRWTCRYSDELPAHEDGALFPFCPPDDWSLAEREAFRTHQSRPTWADRLGHFWAEPAAQQATGKAYHWDVYLKDQTAAAYGLGQLNIARWRPTFERDGQEPPGALHHTPDKKLSRLKKTTGWSC
jgi:hypothetical protein